jgi:hypothetical protein
MTPKFVVLIKGSCIAPAFFETKAAARAWVRYMLKKKLNETFEIYRMTDKEVRKRETKAKTRG